MDSGAESERFEGWFIVELMGRRKLGGFVREQTIAGAGFLRIDVPASDRSGAVTQFVRPETIYALTPTTEAVARRLAESCHPEPVHEYELIRPRAPLPPPDDGPDDDDPF